MGISVGGLASGLDVDGIINQLLSLERRPLIDLQKKIAAAEAKRAAFNDLNGRLASLRSATKAFDDDDLFHTRETTSSDESIVTVTADADAPDGSHTVEVLQIATTHRLAAQGFVDDSATGVAAANGKFSFRVGNGEVTEIDVTASTTLRQLADAVNASDGGVRADIVNDGSPTNPYRLVLTSETEGADGVVTITRNDTTLDFASKRIEQATADDDNSADYLGEVTSSGAYTGTGNSTFVVEIIEEGTADGGAGAARFRFSTDGGVTWDDNDGAGYVVTDANPIALADGVEVNFTAGGTLRVGDTFRIDVFDPELQAPQDAVIKVNGINITKSTNTIDDVFEGLTFQLHKAEPGTQVTLGVSTEIGDVEAKLTAFIGAYNSVIGFLNSQFSFDPANAEGKSAPPLNGDGAARQIQRVLKSFVTGRIPGLTGSTISSLGEIGITSDEKTGLLSMNTAELNQVLDDDPTAVERLLTGFGEALSDEFTFVRRSSKSQPGLYEVRVTQARTRAEVVAGAAADVLAAAERITVTYNDDAQDPDAIPRVLQVDLQAGDDAETQVRRLNQAFADNDFALTAFLDANGRIGVRADAYGDDHSVQIQSDTAAGAGTSNIGNVAISDTGTDLEGTIGGRRARVLDENHLKGDEGFPTEGIEVRIPNDVAGVLGKVRIADGLAEALPDIIDGLTTGTGILRSRTEGINRSIEDFEAQIERHNERIARVEERLRRQFTRLEVTLGQLQALGDYVAQQMASLSVNRK